VSPLQLLLDALRETRSVYNSLYSLEL